MFIRRISRKDGSVCIRLVESVRKGSEIKQVVVAKIGRGKKEEEIRELEKLAKVEMVRLLNERKPALPGFEDLIHGRSLEKDPSYNVNLENVVGEKVISVGVEDVMGEAYSQLDFESLIHSTKKDEQWNEILKATVMARIFEPSSKLQTSQDVLGDLGKEIPVEKIYRMMDRLFPLEEEIKRQIFQSTMSLLDHEVSVMFFDVTTLYFESFEEDELRQSGFSKDAKFKETQIILSLVTNNRGLPLTYELFPGKQSEGSTLLKIVTSLKSKYFVKNVVLVADRAMFTEANLALMESEGMNYIVAAKLRSLKKPMKDEILSNEKDGSNWVKEYSLEGRRLIVTYSADRAKRDSVQREKILTKLKKKSKNGKVPLANLINNAGTKKYIQTNGESTGISDEKVAKEAKWDGLHGVITNFKDQSPQDILEKYKGLWKIEEVFRINKTDLKMRPIYHFKKERIRSHILICFISYTLLAYVKEVLKKNNLDLSVRELRRELSKRQISIIRDRRTQRRYTVPNQFTETQKKIYKAFNLRLVETITPNWNI